MLSSRSGLGTSRSSRFLRSLLGTNLLVIPIVIIVIGLILIAPNFATPRNVENIVRLAAIYMIIGVGRPK